jgi:hypothetical protein
MAEMKSLSIFVLSIACTTLVAGCRKSGTESASPTQPAEATQTQPTPTRSPLTKFETDLQFVRNGLYKYIWVFSRKDGKPLDREDAAFLRKNAPQVVDWVGTDEGKRFIGGTNFNLEQGNLELLKKRFVVEDYSAR